MTKRQTNKEKSSSFFRSVFLSCAGGLDLELLLQHIGTGQMLNNEGKEENEPLMAKFVWFFFFLKNHLNKQL